MRLFLVRKIVILAGAIVGTLVVANSGAAQNPTTQPTTRPCVEDENAQLRARVRELEDRLKSLEQRLDERRRSPLPDRLNIPRLQVPRALPPPTTQPHRFNLPRLLPPRHLRPELFDQNVPPDWHPREFNGLRYYIVPLRPCPV